MKIKRITGKNQVVEGKIESNLAWVLNRRKS